MDVQEIKRDAVVPEGRWEFDADVADAFDDMVARTGHDVIRELVADLAARHLPKKGGYVLDLGCS